MIRRHVKLEFQRAGKLPVLKGTTTIGVVCHDGVVLTTDTRATMGSFVAHKHAKKVYRIDQHIAMTIAGVLESEWKDTMNVKESVPVVVRAIDSAMKRDSASGDSFDVAVISKDGYRELTEDEKKHILHA